MSFNLLLKNIRPRGFKLYNNQILFKRLISTNKKTIKPNKDSLLQPFIVLSIFITSVSFVSNEKKKYHDLEHRYTIKKNILNDIINDYIQGNGKTIDINERLKPANRLFGIYEETNSKETETNIEKELTDKELWDMIVKEINEEEKPEQNNSQEEEITKVIEPKKTTIDSTQLKSTKLPNKYL